MFKLNILIDLLLKKIDHHDNLYIYIYIYIYIFPAQSCENVKQKKLFTSKRKFINQFSKFENINECAIHNLL